MERAVTSWIRFSHFFFSFCRSTRTPEPASKSHSQRPCRIRCLTAGQIALSGCWPSRSEPFHSGVFATFFFLPPLDPPLVLAKTGEGPDLSRHHHHHTHSPATRASHFAQHAVHTRCYRSDQSLGLPPMRIVPHSRPDRAHAMYLLSDQPQIPKRRK